MDFLEFCKENDLINNNSYVFRNLSGDVAFGGNPLSSSAANAQLHFYLNSLNLCDRETPHGTRSACAIILSQLGVDKEAIKAQVGRKSDKMFEHYSSAQNLCSKRFAARAFSSSGISTLKTYQNTRSVQGNECI